MMQSLAFIFAMFIVRDIIGHTAAMLMMSIVSGILAMVMLYFLWPFKSILFDAFWESRSYPTRTKSGYRRHFRGITNHTIQGNTHG